VLHLAGGKLEDGVHVIQGIPWRMGDLNGLELKHLSKYGHYMFMGKLMTNNGMEWGYSILSKF
jgi:hypothetical protein